MAMRITKNVSRVVPPRQVRDLPLVVTMSPEGIYFREFGRRKSFLLPYGVGRLVAVRLHVDQEKRAKEADRKARRAARAKA